MSDETLRHNLQYWEDKLRADLQMENMKLHFHPDPYPMISLFSLRQSIEEASNKVAAIRAEIRRRYIP